MRKILVVGLGQLGLPVAKYIREIGEKTFEVFGYDIREEAMDHAWHTAGIRKCLDFHDFDVYIICIATHRQDNILQPQTEGVFSIVDRISREGKEGALVAIESTIPRGTSRKVFEILSHRMHVVHAPHRWYAKEEKEHGVNQLRVIGGVEQCCLQKGLRFYCRANVAQHKKDGPTNSPSKLLYGNRYASSLTNISEANLRIPMHPVPNVELAELSKVIENAHRYLQIAFAEDLYLYCEANQLDFRQLRAALNTKWNVQILEPREGIGGHCLPKDTRMFLESSQAVRSKILTAALEVDTQYRMYRETIFRNRLKGLDYNKKEELMHILRHSESSPTIQQPNIVASTLKATTEAS